MGNLTRQYVNEMSHNDRIQLLDDWNFLEQTGSIGDCVLRSAAGDVMEKFSMPSHNVILMMREVAFEVYRFYAERYILDVGPED